MTVNLESWQAIGGAIGIFLIAVWGRIDAYRTKKAAQKAAKLSEPTGNGFAKKVLDSLERVEKRQESDGQLLYEHIAAHAKADVAGHATHPRRILRNVNEL